MDRLSEVTKELQPVVAMVAYQAARAGANVVVTMAAFDGMHMRILIAYRFVFAAILVGGLALVIERKNRPKLTWLVVGQSFICGLFSCTLSQNLYVEGLVLTTGTFASAMYNLVPAFTYILAVSFRLERLGLRTIWGKAKLFGTVACIGGAMVLTFYKGPELNFWNTNYDILREMDSNKANHLKLQNRNVGLGALILVCCCISAAMGLIVQAKMIKNYPCTYSSTTLMITMGAIQSVVYALCMERSHWSQWKMNKIRLLSATYNGFIATGAAFILATWCIKIKGPLYVSIFNPLMLVMVAIAGSLVLDEKLHLGSVIGAVIIVVGLYLVLWGKANELNKKKAEEDNNKSIMSVLGEVHLVVVYEESDGDPFVESNKVDEEVKDNKPHNVKNI